MDRTQKINNNRTNNVLYENNHLLFKTNHKWRYTYVDFPKPPSIQEKEKKKIPNE
jgi:hypothetical protein